MDVLTAGTVVAKQHLPAARVLADSFLEHHPRAVFHVLLADEVEGRFQPENERFRLLRLEEMGLPGLAAFRFSHSRRELCYAAAPYLIARLLDLGFRDVAFLKEESLVLGDLGPLFAGARDAVLLTPHLLEPLRGSDRVARELNILQAGSFNAGFVGVSEGPDARALLAWWQERVLRDCHLDVGEGRHYEQRWLDLAPAYFTGVQIVRDPGMNVAHWNLPERRITAGPTGEVLAEGRPCRLFRFSGYDPERPDQVTRYSPRLSLADVGPAAAAVFRKYHEGLVAAGCHETRDWPYAFDRFDNGVPIPYAARRIYRGLGDAAGRFGDPFRAGGPDSFFAWVNEPDGRDGERSPGAQDDAVPLPRSPHQAAASPGGSGSGAVTRLWADIHRHRPDLVVAYPDIRGADRGEFLRWTELYGRRECRVDDAFPSSR